MGLFRRIHDVPESVDTQLQEDLKTAFKQIRQLRRDLVKETTLRIQADSKLRTLIKNQK